MVTWHLKSALWTGASLVLVAQIWGDPFFMGFALGTLAIGVAARFKPRAWQLLVNGLLSLALAARSAWQLWHGQVHSQGLGLMVVAGCVLAAVPYLSAYRRLMAPVGTEQKPAR